MPSAQAGPGAPAGLLARVERRASAAHRSGVHAGAVGHPAVAARRVRAGLLALGWAEHDPRPDAVQLPAPLHALAARMLSSLSHFEAEQGRTDYGLSLLDRADALAAPGDRGILLYQRGLLCMRTWRGADALPLLDEAISLLQDGPDRAHLARALLNRGFTQLTVGDVRRARADLSWCEQVAAGAGLDLLAAKAVHNLGYCDLLAGDIPAALRRFNAAAGSYRAGAPGNLPVLAMDKARALLAAGLADDAAVELDSAITAFRRQRLDQDHAEAELARSQAALAAGDPAAARRWAAAAERRFRRRGNNACALLAELTGLRARAMSPGRSGQLDGQALVLAGRLRRLGLHNDADTADLLGARLLVRAGRPAEARCRMAAVRRRGQAVSLDVSLLRRLTAAELAEREGRAGAALAELRTGLAMVQARRGRLGSLDLQTAAAALGSELAVAGLRLAAGRGSAALLFAWLERSRAQAFRARPVLPPADPQAVAVRAELRQLSHLIRTAELAGQRDPGSLARRADLQRGIREQAWQAGGRGTVAAQASLAEVSAALAESRQSLAAILPHDGRLLAVVVQGGSARLVRLGDAETATEAARRLTADLDTIAGRLLPRRLDAVIRESIRQQTGVLTDEIIAPLRPWLDDGGLVLVPPGALAGVPWGLLPDLRRHPVTVCPSASVWLAAQRRRARPVPPVAAPSAATPLLVAGPHLRHAAQEVDQIAGVYPGCRPITGAAATVDTTLRALDGAAVAHLAAHGHHERGNVLFSRLDLADGPLMAYDIQRLEAAPSQVILSACDVGRTVVRPGGEVLGFTAALLHCGTTSVIASVARVADESSMGQMTAYHRALRAGASPAAALAESALAEPFSPFVCFGAG
jgi:CHAT domain-containing protein